MTVQTPYPSISAAVQFTATKLATVRAELQTALEQSQHKEKITVIAAGSYGRAEASAESDMDVFILFDSDSDARDTISTELEIIANIITLVA